MIGGLFSRIYHFFVLLPLGTRFCGVHCIGMGDNEDSLTSVFRVRTRFYQRKGLGIYSQKKRGSKSSLLIAQCLAQATERS